MQIQTPLCFHKNKVGFGFARYNSVLFEPEWNTLVTFFHNYAHIIKSALGIPIAIRNFVFSGSRLGSYLEVAIEPTHSNTEVLRGLAIE